MRGRIKRQENEPQRHREKEADPTTDHADKKSCNSLAECRDSKNKESRKAGKMPNPLFLPSCFPYSIDF
jgi:hypothetical protein